MCNHTAAICFVLCGRSKKASELAGNFKKNKKKNMFCKGFEELFKAKLELCVNVGP